MASIMKLEDECQEKLDKLNIQIQDRMKLLREYEIRITRLENANKKSGKGGADWLENGTEWNVTGL